MSITLFHRARSFSALFSKFKPVYINVVIVGCFSVYARCGFAEQSFQEQWQYCAKPDRFDTGNNISRVPTALLGDGKKQNI